MIDPKKNNNDHIVEVLKEEDNSVSDYSSHSNQIELKEKMRKLIILVVGVIIVFIIIWLISLFSSGSKSYVDIENTMIDAATKYYSANKNLLPKNNKGIDEVSLQKLINLEYMKELSKYNEDASSCSGKVVVENSDDDYLYIPYLDCGSKYKTTELFRKITNSDNVVTSEAGLYYMNGEYVFRGDNVNNYVSLNNNLWRIVKVDGNDETVLVLDSAYDMSTYWDDRYNSSTEYNYGYNDYKVSRINDHMKNIYVASKEKNTKEFYELLFSKNTLKHLVGYKLCYGKRGLNDSVNNNSLECGSFLEDTKVGLLTLSDYINASLDNSCSNASSMSCQNYNYLASFANDWWLQTADNSNNYNVFYVTAGGIIKSTYASSYFDIRPVVHLNSKTMFKSGKGTKEKPYKIK